MTGAAEEKHGTREEASGNEAGRMKGVVGDSVGGGDSVGRGSVCGRKEHSPVRTCKGISATGAQKASVAVPGEAGGWVRATSSDVHRKPAGEDRVAGAMAGRR